MRIKKIEWREEESTLQNTITHKAYCGGVNVSTVYQFKSGEHWAYVNELEDYDQDRAPTLDQAKTAAEEACTKTIQEKWDSIKGFMEEDV